MIKLYALIFVIAILGGFGYGAKYYYDTTHATISTLRQNNVKLETAVQSKDAAIKSLQENMEKQIKLTKDLNNRLAVAEENNKKISKILAETDIVKNSIADPIASEKKINEEVVNMFSGISAATK